MSTLFIRNLDSAVAARIHRAAQARGMTLAQYLSALSKFHAVMRDRADAGDDGIAAELKAIGLQTISQ